jgi:N6-adenosine-specific RNA methylase IME4
MTELTNDTNYACLMGEVARKPTVIGPPGLVRDPFVGLKRAHFQALLADPPWRFITYDKQTAVKARGREDIHYLTMTLEEIKALPVASLAADDAVLFLWATWPNLLTALAVIEAWGFTYKTGGFDWMKTTRSGQPAIGMGFWTRANTEPCLLATRGHPKRLHADVRQAILEPRREHSRKPDTVRHRIERLVAGPYLELFARDVRPGWAGWGEEIGTVLADGRVLRNPRGGAPDVRGAGIPKG